MSQIVVDARNQLAELADPVAAPQMQAYMKSAMPFRGVAKPARERLLRALVAAYPLADGEALNAATTELWDGAVYREERYLALALVGHRRYSGWPDLSWVPVFGRWIVDGAWWDFTDEIASRRIGPLLREHPDELTPTLRRWSVHPDRWLRRTSVICQLGAKEHTDLGLLTEAVEANIGDPDFFLRKGIGWALRQYARVDPGWVQEFVAAHPALSTLSRKEALRRL